MRFGLLGDAILLVPALRDLRDRLDRAAPDAPRARIDVLVTPLQAPILARLLADGTVDALVTWAAGDLTALHVARHPHAWRAALATVRKLASRRYDLAISCYGRLGSAVAVLAGIPRRAGIATEGFPGTLTHAAPGHRYESGWHEAAHGIAAVRTALPDPADVPPPTGMAPDPTAGGRHRLPVDPAEGRAARARLDLPADTPLVVLHPGATNGSAKRWPAASWATVAASLAGLGTTVVIVGGPEDQALGAVIARAAGSEAPPPARRAIHDRTGRTTIDDLAGLLVAADVVVTGDSGPLHLAVALDRPVVAIHGPTDPSICGPVTGAGPRVAILVADLPCRPCYSLARMADCPLGHTLCQHLVLPRDVLGAIARMTPADITPGMAP